MADLTEQDYKDALAALKQGSGVGDEARTFALQIQQEWEDQHPPAAKMTTQVSPDFPVLPQVLATAPATTHPGGDQAAADEWVRASGQSKGTVFVYEPPVAVVRKRLVEDPQFARALYPDVQISPEEIQNLSSDSDIYRTAADHYWTEAAAKAMEGGRTAYRYSKAPWLQAGGGMTAAETFGTKLLTTALPVLEGLQSFVLGVDDTAALGEGRRAEETVDVLSGQEPKPELAPGEEKDFYIHPTLGKLPKSQGVRDEAVNSVSNIPGLTPQERNAALAEEHPYMHTAGQTYGAFAEWAPFNYLMSRLTGAGAAGLAKVGMDGAGGKLAAGAASGAVTSGLESMGHDAVDAGAELAQTGQTNMTLKQSADRALWPAISGGALGFGGELLGQGIDATRKWVADGPRYGGMPGRLDQKGVEFSPLKGPVIDEKTQKVLDEAKALDVPEVDVSARDLAPHIAEGADKRVKETIQKVTENKRDFYATDEGKQRIPIRNFMERATDILRRRHQPDEAGELLPIGKRVEKVRDLFNEHIAGVSTKPSEGAIKLTPEEAETFLSASHQQQLRPKKAKGEAGGAREFDPTDISRDVTLKQHAGEKLLSKLSKPPFPVGEKFREAVGNLEFLRDAQRLDGDVIREVDETLSHLDLRDNEYQYIQDLLYPEEKLAFRSDPFKGATRAESLAKDLRGRGVTEVYVVPQRYDAQRTEELIQNELKGSRIENKSYRELNELDEALRMDRDTRTLGGEKGGWSALQAKHEELLRKVKGDEKLAAPNRDAFGPLVQSGTQSPGELPRVQAQRAAAEAAGPQYLQQFEAHRALDPLMTLRNQVQYGKVDGKRVNIFSPNSAADNLALRAYPLLKRLEGPMSPVRRAAQGSQLGRDDEDKKLTGELR
jgi:hypothetical protein